MLPFRNVKICYSQQSLEMSKYHPKFAERYKLTMSLISAYNLLGYSLNCNYDKDRKDNYIQNLSSFHNVDYLKLLKVLSESSEENIDENQLEEYGLQFDCYTFSNVFDFCLSSVCNTMTAAKSLLSGETLYAINWHGGWHHAKKDQASGFCYVNDIVYGIMMLMKKFNRILYIDVDLHHGDGVEEAFLHTSKVFTLSFHYSATGFFPPSCSEENYSTGFCRGLYSAARFPFRNEGVTDERFCSVFDEVFDIVVEIYHPEAIVFQCGTDGLVSDPHKVFGLTHLSYEHVASRILQINESYIDGSYKNINKIPILVLGGGGYNFTDSAIVWTRVTARFLGVELETDIPNHEYIEHYSPCYELYIRRPMRKYIEDEKQTKLDIEKIRNIMKNFDQLYNDN